MGARRPPASPVSAAPTPNVVAYTRGGLTPSAAAMFGFSIVPRAIRPSRVRRSTTKMTARIAAAMPTRTSRYTLML